MKTLQKLSFSSLLVASLTCQAEDLLTIYQQALQADPRIHSSQLQIDISEDRRGQALGEMLPQVNANANWSANTQRGFDARDRGIRTRNFHGTRYTVSLTQSLIDFTKFWNWERTQKVIDQTTAENTETLNRLMFDIVERYFNVLEAQDQLALVQKTKEATGKQLQQVKKQFAKQMVKITDVYEVETRLDTLVADEIEAENILVVAKENLTELTGKEPEDLQPLTAIQFKPIEGDIEEWIAVAKSQNPTIAAQAKAIEAADDDVAAQKSGHLPVVEFQMNYINSNTGFDSAERPETETQVAAINVRVPIFSGGVTTHRVSEAKHRLAVTKYDYQAKVREVVKETKDAYFTTNTSFKRIEANKKALTSAVKSRQAMEKGFEYGVETVMDVLNAWQHEYRAGRDLARAKYDYITNRIRFVYAMGMITEENLQEVNDWLKK